LFGISILINIWRESPRPIIMFTLITLHMPAVDRDMRLDLLLERVTHDPSDWSLNTTSR
jgi:hypothetical protein